MTMPTEPITALVWTGDQCFERVAFPLPKLKPGETLVRLTTATICGSDLHTVSGRRSAPCPSILGHEGVGIVQETRNPQLEVGQRVTFSVIAPCLECDRCNAGRTAKCRNLRKTGHESVHSTWPLSGTYATHIVVRNHQCVVPVPDSLEDAPASLAACAGATVMAAIETAHRVSGSLAMKRILVMGVGMLGLIAVEAAAKAGAIVTAVDFDQQRLSWARAVGATNTATPDEFQAHLGTRADTIDVSFEFSGAPTAVHACIHTLDIGGVAVLVGSVADSPDVTFNPEWLVRGWRTVTGIHNYEPRHLTQALNSLANSDIPWSEVIGPPVSLQAAAHAVSGESMNTLRTAIRLDM